MRVYGRVLGGSKWLLTAGVAACILSNAGAAASSKGTTVSISPTALTFSGQNVGASSAAQTITISNSGSGSVSIGSIAASGDFVQTNTCSPSLNPNGKCKISVSFRPTATGWRSGALTITDNAAGSPQRISLTGTGLNSAQAFLSSSSLSFASQSVGTVSVAQTVTVSNTGTATLLFSGTAASGDFIQSNTCGSSLAMGASCTISVSFQPGAIGTRTGALTITDNAFGSAQTVTLSGTGVGVPQALLAPANLSFSNQRVNTVSAVQTVTLSNTGTGTLGLSSIAASGDFVQTNSCGAALAAGGSCTISVTFQPGGAGLRTGALVIADNATGSPQSISLTGTGVSTGGSISAVWANEGGDKVAQDELRASHRTENLTGRVVNRVWDGTTINLSGAHNEVVSFNLVLEAAASVASNVTVKLDALTGPGGATIASAPVTGDGVFNWVGRSIELFYVRYLQIKGLSYFGYEKWDEFPPVSNDRGREPALAPAGGLTGLIMTSSIRTSWSRSSWSRASLLHRVKIRAFGATFISLKRFRPVLTLVPSSFRRTALPRTPFRYSLLFRTSAFPILPLRRR